MKPCITPGCPHPRLNRRRICADCNRLRQNAQHRERWAAKYGQRKWPACPNCCHYRDCKSRRTDDPRTLPCETLLPDEIGKVYDSNEISLRIWPAMVRL